nr:immunoglobulin heavy chain junction region [Macaca mulatta]MOV50074.1 immunoglobulin heavy chain junction region [Macaca mulatta]MOV50136.1 immunoglobulin heavy chain junction region [Macaca mulatta]
CARWATANFDYW